MYPYSYSYSFSRFSRIRVFKICYRCRDAARPPRPSTPSSFLLAFSFSFFLLHFFANPFSSFSFVSFFLNSRNTSRCPAFLSTVRSRSYSRPLNFCRSSLRSTVVDLSTKRRSDLGDRVRHFDFGSFRFVSFRFGSTFVSSSTPVAGRAFAKNIENNNNIIRKYPPPPPLSR